MKVQHVFKRSLATLSFLVIAIVFAACQRSPEAKSQAFIEAGKKLLEKGDATRAMLQFRNAAQASPKNAEAYYELGLTSLALGDLRAAIANLGKAMELNPKHRPAQLKMAQIKLLASDPEYVKDAQQRLKEMLLETPEDAGVLHALALTELRMGEPHQALEDLTRAMLLAPQNLVIAASMAQAKLNQNDPKGAEEVLQKVFQNSPNSAVAAVVLGRFYVVRDRSAEAEQQFNRALSLDRDNADALQDLAALQLHSGRKEEAEQNYRRLSALPGKRFQFMHAIFLFQEGRQDEAIHELETITRDDPDNREARTLLIRAYQAAQRLSDMQKVLESALKKNPKDLDALLQRAEFYLNAKMYDKAATDLNQVLHLNSDSAPAHYVLAKLHQARGERHTYRQELLAALQLDPTLSAIRIEAAGGMIADGEAKAALSLLDAAGEGEKRLLPWVVERNWVLWSLGELAEMRKGIDAGLAVKQSSDLLLQDGLWKLRGSKFETARKSLERALDINPGDVRALGALNQTYTAQKQGSLALEKVKEYASRNPKAAPVQEFLGVLLVANGDRLGARRAFEKADAADPRFVRADLSLTQLDIADGKLDDAQRRLKPILAADQGNVTARLWLANLEITKGDRKAALEDFRQVVQADPNNAQALNNYAYLLSEVSDRSMEALKYAQRAKELSPTHAAYGDTLGWILYRRGLYSMAVSELERAAGEGGDAVCNYHLAMAYAKVGNLERGKKVLQAGLKQNPSLPEAKTAREMLGMPQ